MDWGERLRSIEKDTMAQLKDFQCATVERIDELFRCGKNRVLIADEVGLGKTLVARGAIAKTALIQYEAGKKLFKIVYICSNQVIANQNIQKLDVFNVRPDHSVSDSRLSMQHLKIAEQEYYAVRNSSFAQLIPLTPTTSFSMTSGSGTKQERALIFAILSRVPKLYDYKEELKYFLSQEVNYWDWYVEEYQNKIERLAASNIGYPDSVINKIKEIEDQTGILDDLIAHLDGYGDESKQAIIQKLRKVFAMISVDMLQPDLVIMDEFQRFKYLIDSELRESETGILVEKFFKTEGLRVLLLSATPYKLYSTMEEIEEAENPDEYYKEFLQVVGFLNDDSETELNEFKEVWTDYSIALREMIHGDTSVLSLKSRAEEELYDHMCRTERISVMESGDFIDDSSTYSSLTITSGDIHTYLDMGRMLKEIGEDRSLLVDYAKSTPYLMSFMNHYKVKEWVEKYFNAYPDEVDKAQGEYLWIDRKYIENYGKVPENNARLETLENAIFQKRSELYMWVPPSRPYYDLEGVYKDSKGFSKILVFSSWEMVPKMIGSMISYEEERRTVGVVSNNKKLKTKNNTYFTDAKLRYPAARLRFNVSRNEPRGMYLFCLIYPSEILADIYNPIDLLNADYSLEQIRGYLLDRLTPLIKPILEEYAGHSIQEDKRWYYMAPVFLDGVEYFSKWNSAMRIHNQEVDGQSEETSFYSIISHLDRLMELYSLGERLGRAPGDLLEVLADMAIGSFAVCAYRSNGGDSRRASDLAKVFINRFNSTEATAAVMLAYSENEDTEGDGHWRNVLRYCCDGGFGAMLDEYVHMVSEGSGFGLNESKNAKIHETMVDALKIHTASYTVDTFPAFKKRMNGEEYLRTNLRSHFAVGFTTKSDGNESKNVERKDSIRNAFNSPMRPFVLATTSIGQEGLDFHYYCRKIMHWNLPSNPIDLEQREGRINRYKCLAIRQDLAQKFSDRQFKTDVWQELFSMAANEIREDGQSELVPYWCLGKNQSVKIERIVPMYPVSRDEVRYQRLIKVLSLYRLTMGQARPEELVNYLIESGFENDDYTRKLFIDLSPYSRTSENWRKMMKNRVPVVIEKKKNQRQLQREKLQEEIESITQELNGLNEQMEKNGSVELLGMIVSHKKWGEGIVTSVREKFQGKTDYYLDVEFSDKESSFSLPQAFEGGFLVSEYDNFLENYNQNKQIISRIEELKTQLDAKNEELLRISV